MLAREQGVFDPNKLKKKDTIIRNKESKDNRTLHRFECPSPGRRMIIPGICVTVAVKEWQSRKNGRD